MEKYGISFCINTSDTRQWEGRKKAACYISVYAKRMKMSRKEINLFNNSSNFGKDGRRATKKE